MVREDLNDLVMELAAILERSDPPDEVSMNIWAKELVFIPIASLPYIKKEMRGLDRWPRNFPNFVKAKYFEWREKNPGLAHECPGECHDGFWEVARYRKELGEWAIFRFACICVKENGVYERDQLLPERLYTREPDRFQVEPPIWALIYPDPDSKAVMTGRIKTYLAKLAAEKGIGASDLMDELQLPF